MAEEINFEKSKEAYKDERYNEWKNLKDFLENNNKTFLETYNMTVTNGGHGNFPVQQKYTSGGRIEPYPYDNSNWKWVCIKREKEIDITISLNMPERNGDGDWITHFDRVGIIISQGDLYNDQAIENLGEKINKNNDRVEYKYVKSTDGGYKSEIMTKFTLPLSQKDRESILEIIKSEISEIYQEAEFCKKENENNIDKNDIDKNIEFLIKRNNYNNTRLVELEKLKKYLSKNKNKLNICSKIDDKNDWMELEILDELNDTKVIISFNPWEQDKKTKNWHALYDRIGIVVTKGKYNTQFGLRNEGEEEREKERDNNKDPIAYTYKTNDGKNYKSEIMTNIDLPLTKDDMKAIVNIINKELKIIKQNS